MKKCPGCGAINITEAERCDCGYVFPRSTGGAERPGPKCPNCLQIITYAARKCPNCDYSYDDGTYKKIYYYFDLKNECKNLATVEASFHDRINKFTRKVEQFGEILSTEIGVAGKPPDEKRPEPAAASIAPAQAPAEKSGNPPAASGDAVKQETAGAAPSGENPAAEREQKKKSAFEAGSRVFNRQDGTAPKEPQSHPAQRPAYQEPSSDVDFEIIFGQKWMLIIGIVIMIFGVGYFLKYSFDNNWIGPAGRVALSYMFGTVLLIAGNTFIVKKLDIFGLYLTGGGIATLYFSTFAGFALYELMPQPLAFMIMIFITAFACFLALFYDTKWLCVLALIGGFLTPVLISTGRDNVMGLMLYMTILNAGILGVAFRKNWELLNTLGFLFTYLLYSGWYGKYYADEKFWPAIIFLNVFYLIYSVVPFAYQFVKVDREEPGGFMLITLNAFIAFGFSYDMIKSYTGASYWVSLITVFYAATFLTMGSYLFKKGKQYQDAFVIALAEASLFLIITVPMIFSKQWITFFWAVQALTIFWMGDRLKRPGLYLGSYALFAIAIIKLMFYDYPDIFTYSSDFFGFVKGYEYMLVERAVASIGVLSMLFAAARFAREAGVYNMSGDVKDSTLIYSCFGILLFTLLNFETAGYFFSHLPAARSAAISILWAVFSISLMVVGFKFNKINVRKVSIGLFLLTVLKAFFYDMAEMDAFYRIISFMMLGFILIITSFFYHKYKALIDEAISGDNKRS